MTAPLQLDFEDGTLQGWIPRGGVELTNTTEVAFGGSRSLKTTGRTAAFHGPSLDLLGQLTKGASYRVTTAVRMVAGETPGTMRVTMERTPTGGATQFDTIASNGGVGDAAWVTLTGTYTFATDVTGLLLYVEASSPTASYYVDSFSIVELAPAPLQSDFEDGTPQGWVARGGGVVLENATEAAFGGSRSLKTTGRSQGFHGPSFPLTGRLIRGATYQVSVSARLLAGQAATTLRVTMQRTVPGGANQFDGIAASANNAVTDAAWVTITGAYSFTTDVTGLLLYVESPSATASYYIDSFSINQLAPPPGPPGNTAGTAADFETGTPEGWTSRTGTEIVTVTSADQHGGSHSLLTTNRTAAFRGPSFNVTNVMFNGSRYRVSLWAKLAPAEPSTQLRVSLERRLGTLPASFHTVVPNTTVTSGAWVQLAATFDSTLANTSLVLYVESASGPASFAIDDVRITFVAPAVAERDIPSVYQSLSQFFPVGAAVWQGDLSGEHAFLLSKHFNSLTSENDMKWSALQPSEGNFTYAAADAQVSFAKANNMSVRGHTLIWHNQTPAWVFNDPSGSPLTPTPENKALLLGRLESHIRAVVTHFGADVPTWDVVHEVIDPAQTDGFRRSPWFNVIGPEYIERAFRVAREVAPNARLVINDFDTTNPTKRAFLRDLIADLKSRGVPIDGIGHQMHNNNIEFPSGQAIVDTINLFDGLVEQEITELDVSIYSGSFPDAIVDPSEIPQDRFVRQGYRYRIFFQAFRQLPGKIKSVTLWGQADDHTWLTSPTRVNAPLLFDTSLRKKLAYWAVVDPLQLPGADVSTTISVQPQGGVAAGQTITYAITVTNNADADGDASRPTEDDLPAANLSLVSAIPAHTAFASLAVPAGWSCSTPPVGGSGPVQCTADSLAVAASAVFTLTVAVVDCATPDASLIVSSASVTSTTADPNLAPNNTASAAVNVGNSPPIVARNGAGDVTLECRSPFVDPGATAVDACDGPVAVTTTGAVNVNVPGTYDLGYLAVDAAGNTGVATRVVRVEDTGAPAIDLVDLTILLPGVKIVFDSQTITINGQTRPLTSGTVTLFGQTISINGTTIAVNGRTVATDGRTILLLLPLHQYQRFTLADLVGASSDSCDDNVNVGAAVVTQVASDEPENATGNRDGNTLNDIVILPDCRTVQLRVERDSTGNGRVYTIGLRVRDAAGHATLQTAKVIVPAAQSVASVVDDGPRYVVTSACP